MDVGIGRPARVTRLESPAPTVAVGEWYWLRVGKSHEGPDRVDPDGTCYELVCVVRVGSNYVKVENVARSHWRVHFEKFDDLLTPAADGWQEFVAARIAEHRDEVNRLMGEVRLITQQLALGAGTGHTQAIALRTGEPVGDYKKALVKAKDKTLPALFKGIKDENESMAMWMKAPLVPMLAQARSLEPVVKAIQGRIFNVELYAGIVEEVAVVRDGDPAPTDTPIHLLQRRAYMDEECLLRYRTGGMDFKDVSAFDAWMAEPENADRLLPFPRCVLAMRIRRERKEREAVNMSDYISFAKFAEWDKHTFLYMRNGDQVFRLRTGIEFGSRLFPDTETQALLDGSTIYAKYFTGVETGDSAELISEAHYRELRDEYVGRGEGTISGDRPSTRKERAQRLAAIEKAERACQPVRFSFYSWVQWTQRSTYYDDIAAVVAAQTEHHNRLVMILQGLLDRSQVFGPHPPWRLWEADGFAAALRLVRDDSRALVPGAAPDFEAYRTALNARLSAGCVTIGQDDAWQSREAEKENARQGRDWRVRHHSNYSHFKPYGNPGPGLLARPVRVTPTQCLFRWQRDRLRHKRWGEEGPLGCRVWLPRGELLNADAYQAGDFLRFFADPRTRADYLKWAPLLLEAEEYKAGNRVVGDGGER